MNDRAVQNSFRRNAEKNTKRLRNDIRSRGTIGTRPARSGGGSKSG